MEHLPEFNDPMTMSQLSLIESLIKTANFDDKTFLDERLGFINSYDEAREFIEYLNENQVDKIAAGLPYSQTDIIQKQKENE